MIAKFVQLVFSQQGATQDPLPHIIEIFQQAPSTVHTEAYAPLINEIQPGLTDYFQNQLQNYHIFGGLDAGQKDLIEYVADILAGLVGIERFPLPV